RRVRLHAGVPGDESLAGQPGTDHLRRYDRDHEGDRRSFAGAVVVAGLTAGPLPEPLPQLQPEVRPLPTVAPATGEPGGPDPDRVQRRTLTLLFGTQIVGGIGVAIGIAVGALLAAAVAGTRFSGLASSAAVVGG